MSENPDLQIKWNEGAKQLEITGARATRLGIMEYKSYYKSEGDGTKASEGKNEPRKQLEWKLAEDWLQEEALESFRGKPVYLNHNRVHPRFNTREGNKLKGEEELAIGRISRLYAASQPLNEGDCRWILVDFSISNLAVIEKIINKSWELSLAYKTDILCQKDSNSNKKYIQTNIRGKHMAIVDKSRAGNMTRIDTTQYYQEFAKALLKELQDNFYIPDEVAIEVASEAGEIAGSESEQGLARDNDFINTKAELDDEKEMAKNQTPQGIGEVPQGIGEVASEAGEIAGSESEQGLARDSDFIKTKAELDDEKEMAKNQTPQGIGEVPQGIGLNNQEVRNVMELAKQYLPSEGKEELIERNLTGESLTAIKRKLLATIDFADAKNINLQEKSSEYINGMFQGLLSDMDYAQHILKQQYLELTEGNKNQKAENADEILQRRLKGTN